MSLHAILKGIHPLAINIDESELYYVKVTIATKGFYIKGGSTLCITKEAFYKMKKEEILDSFIASCIEINEVTV